MPLCGTHEIIKVPERGVSILVKYTKRLFKFVNFQMSSVILYFVYSTYSSKARCSIELARAVNKTYYSVRQISRAQYKLTVILSGLQRGNIFTEEKHVALAAHRTNTLNTLV